MMNSHGHYNNGHGGVQVGDRPRMFTGWSPECDSEEEEPADAYYDRWVSGWGPRRHGPEESDEETDPHGDEDALDDDCDRCPDEKRCKGKSVLELLEPSPYDRILDLGCGDGKLTLDIAKRMGTDSTSSVMLVGQDSDADMIKKAKQAVITALGDIHADLPLMRFVLRDAHDPPPTSQHARYDKVFCNDALHLMKRDPTLVLKNIHSLLKEDGILVAEFGALGNFAGVRLHLHLALRRRGVDPTTVDPWYFPDPTRFEVALFKSGFRKRHCETITERKRLGRGDERMKEWLRGNAGAFLDAVPSATQRDEILAEVLGALRPDCYLEEDKSWTIMCVTLRVRAVKTEDEDEYDCYA